MNKNNSNKQTENEHEKLLDNVDMWAYKYRYTVKGIMASEEIDARAAWVLESLACDLEQILAARNPIPF